LFFLNKNNLAIHDMLRRHAPFTIAKGATGEVILGRVNLYRLNLALWVDCRVLLVPPRFLTSLQGGSPSLRSLDSNRLAHAEALWMVFMVFSLSLPMDGVFINLSLGTVICFSCLSVDGDDR
jgi:hypothetical protein